MRVKAEESRRGLKRKRKPSYILIHEQECGKSLTFDLRIAWWGYYVITFTYFKPARFYHCPLFILSGLYVSTKLAIRAIKAGR